MPQTHGFSIALAHASAVRAIYTEVRPRRGAVLIGGLHVPRNGFGQFLGNVFAVLVHSA
jgi:hypothetical protein